MKMNSASSLLFSEYSAVDWCVFLVFYMSVRTGWCDHKDEDYLYVLEGISLIAF